MRTNVYIDASNLFYGGVKSLGWKVDYEKLFEYLKEKYGASKVFLFGGVETHGFPFNYSTDKTVSIDELGKFLNELLREGGEMLSSVEISSIKSHLKRVRFYSKLENFGYVLVLKPVKTFLNKDGSSTRKANCDVDMTLYMMSDQDMFDRVVVLSGDGDFLSVLKFLQESCKEVLVLARRSRTAREIRVFAGGNFRDFDYLRTHLEFQEKGDSTTE